MEFVRRAAFVLVVLLYAPLTLCPLSAAPGDTIRVSDYQGVQFSSDSDSTSMSADGRWVAFEVQYAHRDVFLHDRETGETIYVTASADGDSSNPALSADGRYLAFETAADNLVPGDSNYACDVVVYDRLTASFTLASLADDGSPAIYGAEDPAISANGRYVAFTARELVPQDDYASDVFVRDLLEGRTVLASSGPEGMSGGADSYAPAISADGRTVAFTSHAAFDGSDVVNCTTEPLQENCADIYVKDLLSGSIQRASVTSGGGANDASSRSASISANGRFVAFSSTATDLVAGDANGVEDIFIHDLSTGTTTRLSVGTDGREANSASTAPSISADGRFVAFTSAATNLTADGNRVTDVFLHDRAVAVTVRASISGSGAEADDASDQAAVTADGRMVAFSSRARNLIADDSNLDTRDVFVHASDSRAPTRLRYIGPDRGFVGEEVVVTASLSDATANTPIVAGQVQFELRENGHFVRTEWAWTDSAGLASTAILLPDGSGTFEMVASYEGGLDQQKSSSVGQLTVARHEVTAAYIGDVTGVRGGSATVAARLTRRSGAPLSGATVRFSLKDGDQLRASDFASTGPDGIARTSIRLDLPTGEYTIEAAFEGDTYSEPATEVVAFSIHLQPTTITYTGDTNVVPGSVTALIAVLTHSDTSAPIVGDSVHFEFLSSGDVVAAHSATTGNDGTARADVPLALPFGTYVVRTSYLGGYSNASSVDEKVFTITRLGTSLTYLGTTQGFRGESVEFSARLDTPDGITRVGLPITFRVTNGAQVFNSVTATTDTDGLARAALDLAAPAGTHTVEARFEGSSNLEPSVDSRPFTVRLYSTTLSYDGAVSGSYGQSVPMRAVLTRPSDKLPVTGERVVFALTQQSQTRAQVEGVTSSEGLAQATLVLDLPAGAYTIVAAFDGSIVSAPSSDTRSFTVTHGNTATSYTGNTDGTTGEPIRLSAGLTRSGGAPITGRPIVFDVTSNGAVVQTALATTDSSGAATISPRVQVPAGRYRIEARFPGDAFFSGSSAAAEIGIEARGSTLVATAPVSGTRGQRVVFTGRLTDAINGLPVAGKTLDFALGGAMGQATTDSDGRARLEASLNEPPGSHTLRVAFAGDGFHAGSEAIVAIEIRWEYTFSDSAGGGLIYLNPSTKEFRFVSPYEAGNIEYDPNMRWAGVNGRTIAINAYYGVDITLTGTFELESGRFQATVSTPTRNYVLRRF
jgi:Tol biopolymer transport system component